MNKTKQIIRLPDAWCSHGFFDVEHSSTRSSLRKKLNSKPIFCVKNAGISSGPEGSGIMASKCQLARIFLNSNYIDGLQHQEKRCQTLIEKHCADLESVRAAWKTGSSFSSNKVSFRISENRHVRWHHARHRLVLNNTALSFPWLADKRLFFKLCPVWWKLVLSHQQKSC